MSLKKWGAGVALAGVTATGGVVASDKVIDPYSDKGSHYELPIKAEIQQGERVEIAKDRPAVTIKGWNEEYAITIEPQFSTDGTATEEVQAKRPFLSKKMEFKRGDVTAFVEPKEGTQNEFDIDFTLDAKPDTNVFTYKIAGADDFDFRYQAALTKEEINEGIVRPENVVGSYAVYHATKADHRIGSTNYATGKVMHIYRPKAIDAKGSEVWAALHIHDDVLSVTVPQSFLDNASYPVRVDPTFGNTSIGGSLDSNNLLDDAYCSRYATGSDLTGATFVSTSAYVRKTSGTTNMKTFFTDNTSAGNVISNTETSPASFGTTAAWTTGTFLANPTLSNSTVYFQCVIMEASTWEISGDSAALGDQRTDTTNSYATPQAIGNAQASLQLSIYTTYTAAATQIILASNSGKGNQTWVVPSDWNSSNNTVQCIGSGGTGASANGGGGGGGAYALQSNISLTPGGSVTYAIGSSSTTTTNSAAVGMVRETYFDGTASSSATLQCSYGKYANGSTGGVGGSTAFSTGSTEFAGGDGGAGASSVAGGGGGGSAGAAGAGKAGGAGNGANLTGGGGGGSNGGSSTAGTGGGASGGAGGAGISGNGGGAANTAGGTGKGAGGGGGNVSTGGGAGSMDKTFDATNGAGGGGGGGGNAAGGAGSSYGGGGGGGSGTALGGQGIIVITYVPSAGGGGGSPPPDDTYFEILSMAIPPQSLKLRRVYHH